MSADLSLSSLLRACSALVRSRHRQLATRSSTIVLAPNMAGRRNMKTNTKTKTKTKNKNESGKHLDQVNRRQSGKFQSFVDSLEDRYKDRSDSLLVDVHTLDVVNSSEKTRMPAKRRKTAEQSTAQSSLPKKARGSSKVDSAVVKYVKPGGSGAANTSISLYQPPGISKLFDTGFQMEAVQELLTTLMYGEDSGTLQTFLIKEAQETLGLKCLPSADSVHPIFHVNDDGGVRITFLYDRPPFTSWKAYLDFLFPKPFLTLCRQTYEILLKPTSATCRLQHQKLSHRVADDSAFVEAETSDSDSSVDNYCPHRAPRATTAITARRSSRVKTASSFI